MVNLNDNAKFKIYVKSNSGVDTNHWFELGNNGKTILSNNYTKASSSGDDAGMKINTTTTFTADDEDEICIVCHKNSGTSGGELGSDHGILNLTYAKSKNSENFQLKYCQSDTICIGHSASYVWPSGWVYTTTPWEFKDLVLTGSNDVPMGGTSSVTAMEEHATDKDAFSNSSIYTVLTILIGKNNKGWNVSILGQNLGMGYQGKVYFPRIESGEIDHGTSGMHDYKDIKAPILEHSQPVNIKNNSKSGYTMLGWYKSWTRAFPKLVDPFNIISSVYYYNSADNQYIKLAENTGPDGHSDGKSSEAGNGNRAKVWNIATNLGSTPAIWVKVSKELTDFETSGGSSNATTNPKAPFVFLTYSG